MSQGTKYPEIFAALAAPLPRESLRKKKGRGGDMLTYMTSRGVMNRFDDVLGPENWKESYRQMPDGELFCRITITLPDGSRVTKGDVGIGQGPDAGIKRKAIYSDALKRAAVKFGVGRYLYRDGMPNYVRERLGIKDGPIETRAEREARDETPQPTGPGREPPATSSRSQVNEAFKPAGQDQARPAHDKEAVKFQGDRIGARGLDVRTWATLVEKEVEGVNARLLAFLVEHNLEAAEVTSSPRATNHMASWAEENGEPAPTVRGAKGDQVRAPLGKLSAHLHGLYQLEGWRDPMRKELKSYLKAKLEDAMQVAENQAFGDPPPPEEGQHQAEPHDDGQLVAAGAGEDPQAWAPGRH
ncbi:Rad52/Rad22 family DNA repair protein [Tundrisphaera lichenicola]|uniref:Rad52/Rad22 family DNA repair protein n=1 Tax=Tundrisphaera lichenicola TaxID=2029860 RepID=UPI003EBF72BA